MKKVAVLALTLVSTISIAQAQQPTLTQEQQFELLKMMLSRQSAQPQSELQSPTVALPVVKDTELSKTFESWKPLEKGVVFTRFRDGFAINGERYIDSEGTITSYGFDSQSGDFTYLAQSDNKFILKTGRAFSDAEPVTIGSAQRINGGWAVTTVTGKKLSGSRLIPLARGFIVARDNTGFRYVPGKGTSNIVGPEQFSIAALQSGDISSTGYILLERTPDANATSSPSSSVGALFNSARALGSTLGIGKKEDYALLNIDTKQIVPVNVSLEDKQVQVMSMCQKRNFFIADCQKMDSFESLFQPNGMKNMTHYFWRITWLNAQGRPVLISQEGGLSKISETDLTTGKKVILFDRTMGISEFAVTKNLDGKISVAAQLGFSKETKDDVVSLLDTLPNVSEKK
jgi:hypothetical protein